MDDSKISKTFQEVMSSDCEKMNKQLGFAKQSGPVETGDGARLVDLCAADRHRVAMLVDELGRHAERTCAADARIAHLRVQLDSNARSADQLQARLEIKTKDATAYLTQLEAKTRDETELRAQLDCKTRDMAELRTQLENTTQEAGKLCAQLEAESRAAVEKAAQAKFTEQKYSELRRNATKVAELNRALESRIERLTAARAEADARNAGLQQRLAEREAQARRQPQLHNTATQTALNQQVVAAVARAPVATGTRESAVLSELFFTSPPTPPELDDLFFLPAANNPDDGGALFDMS